VGADTSAQSGSGDAAAAAVAGLIGILDIEQLDDNLFRGLSPPSSWWRVFGGQVIAQALTAAIRTVPTDRMAHSLHAYFLLAGDPKSPIIYEVERIRDGRSFTTRRVVAVQKGQAIFALSASFHALEEGYDHQAAMPSVAAPESLPDQAAMRAMPLPRMPEGVRSYLQRDRPIELRPVELERYASLEPGEPALHVWFRAVAPLPDDPRLHQAVLAYASDMMLLDASLIAHGQTVFSPSIQAASLDHAMWLHRPFRADDWLLYAQESPTAIGGRGFTRGLIFDRAGTLVASVAQEGLIRRKRGGGDAV
jgi:acyl-CoA thioesterase-2